MIHKNFALMWALVCGDYVVPGAVFYYRRDCIEYALTMHGREYSWKQLRRQGYRVVRFDIAQAIAATQEPSK